jgi:hypothetical protein
LFVVREFVLSARLAVFGRRRLGGDRLGDGLVHSAQVVSVRGVRLMGVGGGRALARTRVKLLVRVLFDGLGRALLSGLHEIVVCDPEHEGVDDNRDDHHHHGELQLGRELERLEQVGAHGVHLVPQRDHHREEEYRLGDQHDAAPRHQLQDPVGDLGRVAVVARLEALPVVLEYKVLEQLEEEDGHQETQDALDQNVGQVPYASVLVSSCEKLREKDVQAVGEQGTNGLLGRITDEEHPWTTRLLPVALKDERREGESAKQELDQVSVEKEI